MRARFLSVPTGVAVACLLAALISVAAQQQSQQNQAPGQNPKEAPKEEPKQGGGMFSGFQRLSGTGQTQEQSTTVTAGAKGAKPGVGRDVGDAQPSADDRARVNSMEQAEPTTAEMDAFYQEGQLSPAQKGASQ
jgi:hypothetical protein